MNLSEIFERAAERIADRRNQYCCCAIDCVTQTLDGPATRKFAELYSMNTWGKYNSSIGWWGNGKVFKNQQARIYALLFAAEFYRKPKRRKRI